MKWWRLHCFLILVETSRTRLDEDDAPAPTRKVIKPDLSLLMSNSFDDVRFFFSKKKKKKKKTYMVCFKIYVHCRDQIIVNHPALRWK